MLVTQNTFVELLADYAKNPTHRYSQLMEKNAWDFWNK